MATVTKTRARKPLADGVAAISRGTNFAAEFIYSIAVQTPDNLAFIKTTLTQKEAYRFMEMVAGGETEPADFWNDKRTLSEKLRALADKLEKQ